MLSWRAGCTPSILCKNSNMIHVLMYPNVPCISFLCSFIYGRPYNSLKKQFWDNLIHVGHSYSGPWLLIGDFNAIMSSNSKQGGKLYDSSSKPSNFKLLFQTHGLSDLNFERPTFTWSNSRHGLANVQERLDRGIKNNLWLQLYPRAFVKHLI